jgi:thiamine biosynthesis protein ThiS
MITVGEQQIAWQSGMTLSQVLDAIAEGHNYAVVRLNGKLVAHPDFSTTQVPDNAHVMPIPMVAGG